MSYLIIHLETEEMGIRYLLFAALGLFMLLGCKKNHEEPEKDWITSENQLRIFAIADVTYIIKADNSLWARGGVFTNKVGNKDKGFKLVEKDVKKIVGDCCSMYILKTDNSVWGTTHFFSLYDELPNEKRPLEKITDGAIDISSGRNFVAILKNDGTAWAYGENGNGEFGIGTRSYDPLPLTKIGSDVKQLATGYSNIYLLKTDGTLWSAGDNIYGKLGYEATEDQRTFKLVSKDIKLVRAQENNVIMINSKNEAWSFGSNVNGSQGTGVRNQDPVYPHKIGEQVANAYPNGRASYFLKTDGTLWASGNHLQGQLVVQIYENSNRFTQVAENVKGMTLESGAGHCIILKDNQLLGSGKNNQRQLSNDPVDAIVTWTKFELP